MIFSNTEKTSKGSYIRNNLASLTRSSNWLYKTLYESNSCSSEHPLAFEDIQFQMKEDKYWTFYFNPKFTFSNILFLSYPPLKCNDGMSRFLFLCIQQNHSVYFFMRNISNFFSNIFNHTISSRLVSETWWHKKVQDIYVIREFIFIYI